MNFRIADTFTDSLAKLTGDEQKAVKNTAFDLQINPAHPSMSFHKIENAKDKNFWSVRVSRDIRIIVHKTADSLMLCFVDHHDKAYQWAERRKLETHPKTGAAQIVEIRETVQEFIVYKPMEVEETRQPKLLLFEKMDDDTLLSYGVPEEWLDDVHMVDEDTLLDLADHLPGEAAEALLEIATGGSPIMERETPVVTDPFEHPDAQRRFRIMSDTEELARALDFPWDKWTIFLHPTQRQIVEKDYNGPVRVSGSAGTGKTIVALHRTVYLARKYPEARILLTTFSDTLAHALQVKLRRLIHHEPRLAERIEVYAIDTVAKKLYEVQLEKVNIADEPFIQVLLNDAAQKMKVFSVKPRFLMGEWKDVVDTWQVKTWEAYRDIKRLGRKTRLSERQRLELWFVFEKIMVELKKIGCITHSAMFTQLAEKMKERRHPPFDFIVVDEAQDISVSQLRFLAALGGGIPNSLFFAGDLGQRIFQTPFSWKSLGVDIRGRSQTLRINYRTSHQIRTQADRLLGPEVSDVDGNVETRRGTVSVFNGPTPGIKIFDTIEQEVSEVALWLKELIEKGIAPHEIGVFVRSANQLDRAEHTAKQSGIPYKILDEQMETTIGQMSISTMHLSKGLEFRSVVVMACDDEIIPLQKRMESVFDDADLEEVYNTERHLLYVACTRARDHLLVTSVDPASEFLDDLKE